MKEEILSYTKEEIEDRYGICLDKIAPYSYRCAIAPINSIPWETLTITYDQDLDPEDHERISDYLGTLPNFSLIGGNELVLRPIRDFRLKSALKQLSDRQKEQVIEFIKSLSDSPSII